MTGAPALRTIAVAVAGALAALCGGAAPAQRVLFVEESAAP